ncbi:15168_t:CDS:2 [Funneliformis caledonium]|uniref:15168_t:CDS:1 n=1 Tax=Funneliformis caledonium TaxID=1117310 RepID=A0A9N9AZ35_9GLOM|nr:15168_t:CDS:2 [Funneliformis caledonium]
MVKDPSENNTDLMIRISEGEFMAQKVNTNRIPSSSYAATNKVRDEFLGCIHIIKHAIVAELNLLNSYYN